MLFFISFISRPVWRGEALFTQILVETLSENYETLEVDICLHKIWRSKTVLEI